MVMIMIMTLPISIYQPILFLLFHILTFPTLFANFVVKVNGGTTLEANEIFLVIVDTLELNGGTSTKVQFPKQCR